MYFDVNLVACIYLQYIIFINRCVRLIRIKIIFFYLWDICVQLKMGYGKYLIKTDAWSIEKLAFCNFYLRVEWKQFLY